MQIKSSCSSRRLSKMIGVGLVGEQATPVESSRAAPRRPGGILLYPPIELAGRALPSCQHPYINRSILQSLYGSLLAGSLTNILRFLSYAIQHKDLPMVRVGRCRLITEKALRKWLERKTEATVETRGYLRFRALRYIPLIEPLRN